MAWESAPIKALYFCEIGNHRISRLDLKTRQFSTFVGTGQKGYAGDGGPAVAALTDEPYEIAFDKAGDLFFCDRPVHVIRKVDGKTHVISTVAGTGKEGYAGDGGPAAQAQFRQPHSIAFAPDGRLLICDILNFRIRSLDLAKGIIDTWAGTGQRGAAPDGAPLTTTPLDGPRALAIDKSGNYYLALREGNANLSRWMSPPVSSIVLPEPARKDSPETADPRRTHVSPAPKVSRSRPMEVSTSPTRKTMRSGASIRAESLPPLRETASAAMALGWRGRMVYSSIRAARST